MIEAEKKPLNPLKGTLIEAEKRPPLAPPKGEDDRSEWVSQLSIINYPLSTILSACRISLSISSWCSKPTEMRISPGVMFTALRSSSVSFE